ncbi:MAG: CBS domain-containing protein, partial [Candidatus Lokiarchaeota archaeon]|nr:CBS domain-containing protein [Candidatus Lokiarchaeota archaeon]
TPSGKIKDIMSPHIIQCDPEDKIPEIAKKMMDEWVDTIFVLEKGTGKVMGIITDGIIWKIVANADKNIYNYKARDIMYKKIITIEADKPFNSIEELRGVLEKSLIKRVAVVSNGKIVGIVRRKFIEKIKRYSRHFNVEFS